MTPDCECWITMLGKRLAAMPEDTPPRPQWGRVPFAMIVADDAMPFTDDRPDWLMAAALRERHAWCALQHGRVREAQDWLEQAKTFMPEEER